MWYQTGATRGHGDEPHHLPHPAQHGTAPDCVAALGDAVRLCADLGHDLVEAPLPGLTEQVAAAIGTVYQATTAWIIEYWTRRLGRGPPPGELVPSPLLCPQRTSGSRRRCRHHFLGRCGAEATLFRLAAQLESARPWAGRRPPIGAAW